MSRKNSKKPVLLILVLCLFLITGAVFGGFALANGIRKDSTVKDTSEAENRENSARESTYLQDRPNNEPQSIDGTILSKTPTEVIYGFDPDTGLIDEILIEILRTAEGKLDYIRIDADVVYTMDSKLYSSLTPDNTTLPQTVTFSQLFRYYRKDCAFEAGRRIISEMIGLDIMYYCALPVVDFDSLFLIDRDENGINISFKPDETAVKGEYGSSVRKFVGKMLENAVTDWDIGQRLRYLDMLDSLEKEDITFADAPVKKKNESCVLDSDAVGRMLYEILY